MLGTRLGYYGGCSIEDVGDLTEALSVISLQKDHREVAAPPTEHIVTTLQVQPDTAACPSADKAHMQSCSKQQPPGELARANHKKRVLGLLLQAINALDGVPPEVQGDVMNTQVKVLRGMVHSTEQAVHVKQFANFQKGDVSFVRKKDAIERHHAQQDRKNVSGACYLQQLNFQRVQKDDVGKVSKALTGGRSFNQAASHVQTCLDMGQVHGEKVSKRTMLSAPGSRHDQENAYPHGHQLPQPQCGINLQQPPKLNSAMGAAAMPFNVLQHPGNPYHPLAPHRPLAPLRPVQQGQHHALALQRTGNVSSRLFGTDQLEQLLAYGLGT
jgi:hypothetical protein